LTDFISADLALLFCGAKIVNGPPAILKPPASTRANLSAVTITDAGAGRGIPLDRILQSLPRDADFQTKHVGT
jgi:hypothetical protein